MSISEAAKSQFDKAYQLVCKIAGEMPRSSAWESAKELLREYQHKNSGTTNPTITLEIT